MITIKVHWLAQLRTAAGKADEVVDMPDRATLADLLVQLAAGAAEPLRGQLLPTGDQRAGSPMLLVNDRNIPRPSAADQRLVEGDEVTLLPPISGG